MKLSGSSSSIGEAGFAFPSYDYMVTFTLDSALTSSESSQNWINSIIERNFKLKISENFINQVSNEGYDVSLPLSTFNLFTTDFGTPPPPTILSQPQNTNHGLSGSTFTISYKFYGSKWAANLSGQTWQYSDNYDESNPELATWNDITSENSIGAREAFEFIGDDLQYLVKTTGSGTLPEFAVLNSTLTVNSWVANRKYRYKYVVV